MLAVVEEAFDARGHESADEAGVFLDQIGMHDDAVADRGHPAIGVPQDPRLLVAADLHTRHEALREAADAVDLAGDQRRRRAGRVGVDHLDVAGVHTAALGEGRPLLEAGTAGGNGQGLAFEVLGLGDAGIGKHHDRGRIAAIDRTHHPDAGALGDRIADAEPVREAELRRLGGHQLCRAARALARADVDVEARVLIEALALRHHEAGVRALVEPVEAHVDRTQAGGARAPEPRRGKGGQPGRSRAVAEE